MPLLPCVALQSALKVVNLTVPGSAGRIAFNVRFLQRMGAPTSEAVAAGGVDDLSETLVQALLIAAILPFVDVQLSGDATSALPSQRLVATVLVVLLVAVGVVLAVPALRAKVLPALKPGVDNLRVVFRTRRKRLELFGGNIASEILFALTLGAAAMAYGVDLTLAQLLLVNMTASALSGLVPVPGGVGAQEAALTAGMVAVGADESTAFAIAITHRMCTYFLPPIWGAFSLRWLRRQGYVSPSEPRAGEGSSPDLSMVRLADVHGRRLRALGAGSGHGALPRQPVSLRNSHQKTPQIRGFSAHILSSAYGI